MPGLSPQRPFFRWGINEFPACSENGFSLIELLAVLLLIGILTTLLLLNGINVANAMRLTQAAQCIADEFQLAKATASGRNVPVDICFLSRIPPDAPELGEVYCGVASRIVKNDGSTKWLGAPVWLPSGILIGSGSTLSSMLTVPSSTTLAPKGATKYIPIRVRPNGEIEPAGTLTLSSSWYVAIFGRRDAGKQPAELQNYAVVQVDPRTSLPAVLRP